MIDHATLRRDGYVLLRGAIPAEWLDALRAAFDAGARPSHDWSPPRGADWLHALMDLDAVVQATCRLPSLLAAVGGLIGDRFFLVQVEGRDPLPNGGHQSLHRDGCAGRVGDTVSVLAFLDDYGPHNGATRFVPGTHRREPGETRVDAGEDARAVQLSGHAGDLFVFDADLLHGGSRNLTGARRRSMLITYADEVRYPGYAATAALRHVRMDTRECFDPAVLVRDREGATMA